MFDLSIFTTPEAWISLITLLFLEIVLGVDNLVFIAITTDRLPAEKQHLGRKIGLLGALFRIVSCAHDHAGLHDPVHRDPWRTDGLFRARSCAVGWRNLSDL